MLPVPTSLEACATQWFCVVYALLAEPMPIGSPLITGFILVGGLATFRFLTRPNRVHLRCGSRVCPYQGFARWIARISCSLGYMYEQAIYMVNTFQFTRSARLILAHRLEGAVVAMESGHRFLWARLSS